MSMIKKIEAAREILREMRRVDGNAVFDIWVDVIEDIVDYAEELETRLKKLTSCNLCKHCDVMEDCAPCKDCIAARTYPHWELAPRRVKND